MTPLTREVALALRELLAEALDQGDAKYHVFVIPDSGQATHQVVATGEEAAAVVREHAGTETVAYVVVGHFCPLHGVPLRLETPEGAFVISEPETTARPGYLGGVPRVAAAPTPAGATAPALTLDPDLEEDSDDDADDADDGFEDDGLDDGDDGDEDDEA